MANLNINVVDHEGEGGTISLPVANAFAAGDVAGAKTAIQGVSLWGDDQVDTITKVATDELEKGNKLKSANGFAQRQIKFLATMRTAAGDEMQREFPMADLSKLVGEQKQLDFASTEGAAFKTWVEANVVHHKTGDAVTLIDARFVPRK